MSDIQPAGDDLANLIRLIRGQRVMLDADLASLYGTTSRLVEAVRRQRERFPEDFMFRLTAQGHESLSVRAFVRLRHLVIEQEQILGRLDAVEGKYDAQFKDVFAALRALMASPAPQRKLGFREEAAEYSA